MQKTNLLSLEMHCLLNFSHPIFLDRHVCANCRSRSDFFRSSLIRVYTVCHSICICRAHYPMVKPHSSNFRIITTILSGPSCSKLTTGPRCPNVLNFYGIPQNLQLYGFLSACTTMWAFSVWGCVNVFPQVSHLNALCALWISMCRTIFAFWLKEREQYGQAYGRRPVWVNWCAFK